MTIRPHDTEQILDTLSEAIQGLRDEALRIERDEFMDTSALHEMANSLALLHGAVEAEAKKADDESAAIAHSLKEVPHSPWFGDHVKREEARKAYLDSLPEGARPKPIDVKPSLGHRARYLGGTVTGDDARIRFSRADKRERIADEISRGEHRED